jgi:hypothetical protein
MLNALAVRLWKGETARCHFQIVAASQPTEIELPMPFDDLLCGAC